MGVPYAWVLDPETKREEKGGILKTENPAISVPLAELF